MGTYKANRNNEEVEPKSEKEQKLESTEKAVDVAGETALDYFTSGQFSQIKGMAENVPIVGDKVGKTWDKAVETVSKPLAKTPIGDVAKGLDDAGVTDAARTAKNMINFSSGGAEGATGAVGSVNSAGTSNNLNSLGNVVGTNGIENPLEGATVTGPKSQIENNNESNESGSILPSGNNDSKSSGFGNISISKSTKIKLIAIGAAAFLFFIIITTAFGAADDEHNLSLTDQAKMTEKSGSRKCTNAEVESRLIYVGDSRTEGMQSAVGGSANYIAKSSMGYSWLNSDAIPELETKLESNSNAIVILALGVNDLHNIDNYISTYKALIAKFPDVKFYVLSVNPVDDDKAASNGYEERNSNIESFNSKLKESFSDNYIDSYSGVTDYNTTDGLHYDAETYKKIHEFVLSKVSSGVTCASAGDVMGKLEEVANWYIANVTTYQQNACGNGGSGSRKYYETPFGTRKFGDDCTEFTGAYMSYVAGVDLPESYSGEMINPNGSYAKSVGEQNWKAYSADEIDSLLPGDVLVADSGQFNSTKGHHAEVYVDESHTFGWGSCKNSYPSDKAITKSNEGGHTHYKDSGHDYTTIYRFEGVTTTDSSGGTVSTEGLNITKMNDSSFNHGTKPKSNQKYIMLHDTEMSGDATAVVNAWKNSGNGVAAHFVVNRDGTVIQAVELDTITHHAGWGGPGDFDTKFGVGNNDGKGNGDDLVGTTKTGYASYTSYGMNSYSVGIEMCHVGGEDYPEAQLEAVDKVIAYIDNYFGFKSKIIDHKDWRPSNSDTDQKFTTYLKNYKASRHH